MSTELSELIDSVYRTESRRILSTLIRLVGDIDLAEDVMQDAFSLALTKWHEDGVPLNPRAWIVSVAKFKAIDIIRRQIRTNMSLGDLDNVIDTDIVEISDDFIEDDLLRLIFTCCHPSLPNDAQVALTLREVCDLTTEEIAKAFLASPTTIGQRIVRAKAKIREEKIPYVVPEQDELPERLENVLRIVYLVFNEGYYASSGMSVTRHDLSGEAIRIGRLLVALLPDPEVYGLLGLMLLQESRRAARMSPEGDIVLIADQDRSLWNRAMIAEGIRFAEKAFERSDPGVYGLQAGIAATHASASNPDEINWTQIVDLYDRLLKVNPSPVVELNRAVALAMVDGPEAGLIVLEPLMERLDVFGMAHSARADFYRRLGRNSEALDSYRRALALAEQEPERRFLVRRIEEVEGKLKHFVEQS